MVIGGLRLECGVERQAALNARIEGPCGGGESECAEAISKTGRQQSNRKATAGCRSHECGQMRGSLGTLVIGRCPAAEERRWSSGDAMDHVLPSLFIPGILRVYSRRIIVQITLGR